MAFKYSQKEIAKEIHYPECWDTMAYPTLDEAVLAIVQSFSCDVGQCHSAMDSQRVNNLRGIMDTAGVSSRTVCRVCDIPEYRMRDLERGDVWPTLDEAYSIANVLDVSVYEIWPGNTIVDVPR